MIPIPADSHWFATGYQFQAGKKYRLTATGTWYDDKIACSADGYKLQEKIDEEYWPFFKLVEPLRPLDTGDQWFQLIGKLDKTDFLIGTACEFTAQTDGELFCTANDCPFAYWNNQGTLQLSIEEIV